MISPRLYRKVSAIKPNYAHKISRTARNVPLNAPFVQRDWCDELDITYNYLQIEL